MTQLQLWAGLGNPGASYANHRHNIGFMAIDAICDAHDFPPDTSRFNGLCSQGHIDGYKILTLKPSTFMNESGIAVRQITQFFKITPENIIVFHDEIDLAPGRLRVKSDGGMAGHNGLRSIYQHMGAGFHRIRLGIGHPGHKNLVQKYVLSSFAPCEQDWKNTLLSAIAQAAPLLATQNFDKFQTLVHQSAPPPIDRNKV